MPIAITPNPIDALHAEALTLAQEVAAALGGSLLTGDEYRKVKAKVEAYNALLLEIDRLRHPSPSGDAT